MKTKSFTLIELLVVIVIIGILSGVIVISVTNYINDAKNTKIVAELSNLSKSFEGYSNYYVGSLCIEDTANNAAFLSYYGLSSYPKHPNYTAGSTSLTTNDCYLYFSDGTNYSIRTPSVGNKGYLIQESRTQKTQPIQKTCDTGWIPFGNRCVMQYEAKCSEYAVGGSCVEGTSTLVSQAAGTPWGSITQPQAEAECEKIGAHLITNAEWMSLARDIEQVGSNWTGGTVGSGMIKRGNVGTTDDGSYDGENPEEGILNDKAKLRLSNGEYIYHFSGNVWEWVDETVSSQLGMAPSQQYLWREIKDITNWGDTKQVYSNVGPKDNLLVGTNGVGRIYYNSFNNDIRAVLRGGHYGESNAGIFVFYLGWVSSNSGSHVGFRCVK